MSARRQGKEDAIPPDLVERVRTQLDEGARVRRSLPIGGRISVDHPVPFLLVHRRPDSDDAGTEALIRSEAAYLTVPRERRFQKEVSGLVGQVVESLGGQFGGFLLIELWSATLSPQEVEDLGVEQRPRFRILVPRDDDPGELVDSLDDALARIRLRRLGARVRVASVAKCAPKGAPELLSADQAAGLHCTRLGLEVFPVYQNPDGSEVYPELLRRFKRLLSRALRRTFYEFARTSTTHRPAHFHVLGRRAVVKAVWEVDRQLAAVADEFDFLLQVSPANSQVAWSDFKRSRYEKEPRLHYRHHPFDPARLKRRLFQVPIERIEDPALSLLFRQKQEELDRQITMLVDRNTPRFLHGSLQLYGRIEDELVREASVILESVPPHSREAPGASALDAASFADRAREELAFYEKEWKRVSRTVEVRDDIASGLMVSRGVLRIGSDLSVPESRVEALLQHEIGTHVVTYYNGLAQPFQQLRLGLAGYDALQEGLAVLAEYLVGGLSRPRLRLLAARVLAAEQRVRGAGFLENFRFLVDAHGFNRRTAFGIVLRIHRGGGLTKDALYLQGLLEVMKYLSKGGKLRPLFVGKLATEHVPIIRELTFRKVLNEPPLMPRYLEFPHVAARLEAVREGIPVTELVRRKVK